MGTPVGIPILHKFVKSRVYRLRTNIKVFTNRTKFVLVIILLTKIRLGDSDLMREH